MVRRMKANKQARTVQMSLLMSLGTLRVMPDPGYSARITRHDEQHILVKGGEVVWETHFKSATNQTSPLCAAGEPAIEGWYKSWTQDLADVGLVGFPMQQIYFAVVISAAKPKIADYPLPPSYPTGNCSLSWEPFFVMATYPYYEGRMRAGDWAKFLRHIERIPSCFSCAGWKWQHRKNMSPLNELEQ